MRGRWRGPAVCLVFFVVLTAVAHARLASRFTRPYPVLTELRYTEHYAGDLGALMLGTRRVAGDVAYIQFLQYYGTRSNAEPENETASDHHDHDHGHGGIDRYVAGAFPRLLEFATRVLRLDPFFHGAVLEAAGALAFNERRIDESLSLLREAIQRDPTFYRYHLYATAILYREKGDDAALIDQLLTAIETPDCPPLLEGVLGNLLRKNNRPREAAEVYLHTYRTASRASDRETAHQRLVGVLRAHPEVAPSLNLQGL